MSARPPTPESAGQKRRLSLRLENAEKRTRSGEASSSNVPPPFERGDSDRGGHEEEELEEDDDEGEMEPRSLPLSDNSGSPGASSYDGNDGDENMITRSLSQSSQADPSSPRLLRSKWRMTDDAGETVGTSREGGPLPSQPPSPPSFTLATGQPLVNPPLKTQAAFVGKLYAMLADDKITRSGLLHWSDDGTTFVCPNPQEFSKEVLPNYFKHNNWQSFVRQLNMYSFNKVSDLYTVNEPSAWEFRHPLFQRGKPQLLPSIKRKSTRQSQNEGSSVTSPIEEGLDSAKPVAGWMRDAVSVQQQHQQQLQLQHQQQQQQNALKGPPQSSGPRTAQPLMGPSYRVSSPPTVRDYGGRPSFHGYQQVHRPPSRPFDPPLHSAPPISRVHQPPPHPVSLNHPDTPYYQQPSSNHPSPADGLANQVVLLEEQVNRLRSVINAERVAHATYSLETTHHLKQMVDWIIDGGAGDFNTLRNELIKQEMDIRSKLDAMSTKEPSSAIMGGREERHSGPGFPSGSLSARSLQSALHDPRQVHTSHIIQDSSPLTPGFPDRIRPATSDPVVTPYSTSPVAFQQRPYEIEQRELRTSRGGHHSFVAGPPPLPPPHTQPMSHSLPPQGPRVTTPAPRTGLSAFSTTSSSSSSLPPPPGSASSISLHERYENAPFSWPPPSSTHSHQDRERDRDRNRERDRERDRGRERPSLPPRTLSHEMERPSSIEDTKPSLDETPKTSLRNLLH